MIAVLFAMEEESKWAKKIFDEYFYHQTSLHKFQMALKDKKIYTYMMTGIGKANAASTTTSLLQSFNTSIIINIGTAGSIKPMLKRNDVVICTKIVYGDVDITSFGYAPGQMAQSPISYDLDPNIETRIVMSLRRANIDFKFGTVGTSDSFVHSGNIERYIPLTYHDCDLIDMEAAAIAQICKKQDRKFFSIKVISDSMESQSSEEDFKNNMENISIKIKAILEALFNEFAND